MTADLLIIGAGPAGAACALAAARAGLRVVMLERAVFPRHKVCGDCLNPGAWPVLAELGIADAVRALQHADYQNVRFVSVSGKEVRLPVPPGSGHAVKRSLLDEALLTAAAAAGAEAHCGEPVKRVWRGDGDADGLWHAATDSRTVSAPVLVAADGRNSTTCRLLGLAPPARPNRVAIQTHAPLTAEHAVTVTLELTPQGYRGIAPVSDTELNVCVVSTAAGLAAAKTAAARRFGLGEDHVWHTIAPLERADVPPAPQPGLFLAGDTARVVEPFTGEGIHYALLTGVLAARAAVLAKNENPERAAAFFREATAAVYHRRLWINRLTRAAVTRPVAGSLLLAAGRAFPGILRALTAKVMTRA